MFSVAVAKHHEDVVQETQQTAALQLQRLNRSSLMEWWTKAGVRRHFRTFIVVSLVVLVVVVASFTSGSICGTKFWNAFGVSECFDLRSVSEDTAASLEEFATAVERYFYNQSLSSFCCSSSAVDLRVCFDADVGVAPGGLIVRVLGNQSLHVLSSLDSSIVVNATLTFEDFEDDGAVVFPQQTSPHNATFCCDGIGDIGFSFEYDDHACTLYSGLVVVNSIGSLLVGFALLVAGAASTAFTLSYWAPTVQRNQALLLLGTGVLAVVFVVWIPFTDPFFCQDIERIIGADGSFAPCNGTRNGNQISLRDDFETQSYVGRLLEAIFTAGTSSLFLLLGVNALSMAHKGNHPLRKRIIWLNVLVGVQFLVRLVAFLWINQQFGIVPFVHIASVAAICDSFRLYRGFETAMGPSPGLVALQAQPVVPRNCASGSSEQIAMSFIVFGFEVLIVYLFRDASRRTARLFRSKEYGASKSAQLRFRFVKWNMASFFGILLVLGIIAVASTPIYVNVLFEYNFGFHHNRGAACEALSGNIVAAGTSFSEFGIDVADATRKFSCLNSNFSSITDRIRGQDINTNSGPSTDIYSIAPDSIATEPSSATLPMLFFCCNMPDFPQDVWMWSLANLGVGTRTPVLAAFLVLILFMQFELIRSLATVDQATHFSGRWVFCLRRPPRRRFNVPVIEYFLTEIEAHKKYFNARRSQRFSHWGQTPFTIQPHAASLFSMHVPSPPRQFAMVLERQIVMASLSYLVYKAGAVVAKQGKLARSTKTLSNNFDEKLELPKNDPGNSEQQTAACDPSIFHERTELILSKLLSTHQTGMHSRALISSDREAVCWIIEAATFIGVVWRGTATLKNVQDDLAFGLCRLAAPIESQYASHVNSCRRKYLAIHAEMQIKFVRPKERGRNRTFGVRLQHPPNRNGHEHANVEREVARATMAHFVFGSARVHQGFHDAYVELRDKVFKKVNALRAGLRKTVPVFVTGHSMGGAIATLCAFDLGTRLGPSNVMCSTFGCPRIGNTAFHRNYESLGMPTWRFANSHDPVTHLPAAGTSTKDRYHHVGTPVLLLKRNMLIAPSVLEYFGFHVAFGSVVDVNRHRMIAFVFYVLFGVASLVFPDNLIFMMAGDVYLCAGTSKTYGSKPHHKTLFPKTRFGKVWGKRFSRTFKKAR
eukprot:INCI6215.1.p1 GENE.INCI6215.1~~INCI6215.1.p1  ORF type:complete len:1163 (+),score=165.41 INCI6215.1:491-3979(+)